MGTAIRVMEHEPFGDPCPFAEPAWYRGVPTPYYNENHAAFRAKVRAWVDENLIPSVDEWDEAYTCPIEKLRLSAHKAGVLSPWAPEELGGTPPEGGWDEFMFVIWADEPVRCGRCCDPVLYYVHGAATYPRVWYRRSERKHRPENHQRRWWHCHHPH